jgi:hypothetical protein
MGGAKEVVLDFTHTDLTIEVQYRPEYAAHASHDAHHITWSRRADRFPPEPAFWGRMGAMLHSAQAGQLMELRNQCREAMKLKQAEVGQAGMSVHHRPERTIGLAAVRVPRLSLEAATTMSSPRKGKSRTSRVAREHYEDVLASPRGPYSVAGLRGAMTDREMRRRWLASTEEFNRESILEPYSTPPRDRTPFVMLSRKQIKAEEELVRSEASRISQVLHRVNVSLMKGSATMADPGAQERHNMLEDIQQDMREHAGKLFSIVKSSAEIAGDERFKSTPHRYDFIKANHEGTAQTRTQVRGARSIRNAVVWVDKANSALYSNMKKTFEVAEKVEDDLIRRDLRLQAARLGEEHASVESAQKLWLTATVLALLNFRYFRPKMKSVHMRRECCAKAIQKCIRKYLKKIRARKARSSAVISRWYVKNRETIRVAAKNRAASKIKLFIMETKDTVAVMPAIRRYKKAVVTLQQKFRETGLRQIATRKKLLQHYDKVEKLLLMALLRDKMGAAREKVAREANPGFAQSFTRRSSCVPQSVGPKPDTIFSRKPSVGLQSDLVDWCDRSTSPQTCLPGSFVSGECRLSQISTSGTELQPMFVLDRGRVYETGDYSKLRTPQDVKLAVIRQVMRKARDAYAVQRKEHGRAMKEFRMSFRQTTLFRTQMHDFLCAIDQEHRLGSIDELAGKNQELIKSLNKDLPIAPKWSDAVSDDHMKFAVSFKLSAPRSCERLRWRCRHERT